MFPLRLLRSQLVCSIFLCLAAIFVTIPTPAFSQGITITSPDSATFTATEVGSFTFTATGEPAPTFSIAPALPAGLTLSEGGVLSGIPSPGTAGEYDLTVTASNGVSPDATQDFVLTVARVSQTIFFQNPGTTRAIIEFGVLASASSFLPVTVESLTPSVCSLDGPPGHHRATTLIGGTCTLVARQAGNAGTYLPAADVVRSFTVTRIEQTISFTTPTVRTVFSFVSLSGFVSPFLRPVTFTSVTPDVCPPIGESGRVVQLVKRGTCTVVASHPGDEVYLPAEDVSRSFDVLTRTQAISFTNPGPQVLGSGPVPLAVSTTISGTAMSGLPPTLTSTTPTVCATSGHSAVLLAVGTCTIVASQAGDDAHDPAEDVTESFSVILGTPDPPTGVVAHVNGNFVSLSWSAAPTGATPDAFLVEVGDGPGRTTTTAVLTPLLGDTGLLPQGEYYMRVRALNDAGLSGPSDEVWVRVSGTDPVALPPVAPGVVVNGATVQFRWNPAETGASPVSYLVQVGTDPLSADLAQIGVAPGTTELSIPNVPPGTYVLRVRAISEAGPSPPSPAIWLRVGPAPSCGAAPNAPLMLTPVVSDPSVALSWLPPADGSAESFVVQAGTQAGQSDLAAVGVGAVGGVGTNVGAGQYFVRAVSASECGASAPTVEQIITVGGPMPDAPTGLAATSGPGGVTFTWTPPAGVTATHYVVEAGLTSGTTLLKFPVTGTPTLTIPGVPPGTTFVARVRGANASGIGAASPEIVVTVP